MDIIKSFQNQKLLRDKIEARLSDERTDWKFVEELYVPQGRYLQYLPTKKLLQRYRDLIQNIAFLVDETRDQAPAGCHYLSSWWWIEKYLHMKKEFGLRSMEQPPLPPESGEWCDPEPLIRPARPNSCEFLVRYGERKHLEEFVKLGRFRLSPASTFADGALDPARRDKELVKRHYSHGSRVQITTENEQLIEPIGFLEYSKWSNEDYFCLCASNEHDPRLFREFVTLDKRFADAAVIVWDVELARRLEEGVLIDLPGWDFFQLPIEYYDPYQLVSKQKVTARFSKDFKYAYQREYRFIWIKEHADRKFEFLYPSVGALEDIATLVTADGEHVLGRKLEGGR